MVSDGHTHMFRKLVSNLMYSPSLMGQFSAYAERLKREEFVRRVGLIITTLAVGAHAFFVLQPPSSANTANPNDLVFGGVTDRADLLKKYDSNERNLQDILSVLGITREDLDSSVEGTASLKNATFLTGRTAGYSYQSGEREYTFEKSNGDTGAIYLYNTANLALDRRATYPALIAHSELIGKFAILKASGNIALTQAPHTVSIQNTCQFDQTITATASQCAPCPSDTNIGVGEQDCRTPFILSKSAANASQRKPAEQVTAHASDRILFTLTAKNISSSTASIALTDRIDDVLEYADVIDTDGGIFDPTAATLSWPEVTVATDETTSKTFAVRLKPHIAATAQGVSNPTSYDCIISNTHGNSLFIPVACPLVKNTELITSALPTFSGMTSLAVSLLFLLGVVYFYLRARLLQEEVRLIRRDINTGALS